MTQAHLQKARTNEEYHRDRRLIEQAKETHLLNSAHNIPFTHYLPHHAVVKQNRCIGRVFYPERNTQI